ncbi:MAG TPA: TolC family protein [Phycisphaerae bacterium]|nr:TolC family protein [Phycisphaerae bacterium]
MIIITLLAGGCIIGCVDPGKYDVNDVYKLQQSIMDRSPQNRSDSGTGPMIPSENSVPRIKMEKNPKTNRYEVSLSLRETVMRALANNPQIAVVSFTPQISRELVVQAASQFDYTIFGGYEFTHTESSNTTTTGNITGIPTGKLNANDFQFGVQQQTITGAQWSLAASMISTRYRPTTNDWDYDNSIAFNVTQPLLRGAGTEVNLANLRIARLNYKISMSQFNQNVQQTVVSVMSAYYNLIKARQLVVIAENLLAVTEQTYRKVSERHSLDATKVQIKQSETAVRERQAALVLARKNARDAQDALLVLLGDEQLNLLGRNMDIIPATTLTSLPVLIDPTDQYLTALRLNPQLEQLRLAVSQSDINIMVAENQALPSLNLTAGATLAGDSSGTNRGAWNGMLDARYTSYNAALMFEYPLGNRQRLSAVRQSKLQRRQAISNLQSQSDQLAQQIRESIRQINTQYEEIKIRRQALDAAKEQLDALDVLEKIRAKLTPEFLNLKLNAQATVATSESNLIDAQVLYNVAMLNLSRYTGTVLELNQVQLSLPVVTQPDNSANPLTLTPAPPNDAPVPLPSMLQSSSSK